MNQLIDLKSENELTIKERQENTKVENVWVLGDYRGRQIEYMPKFLDAHNLKGVEEETLRKAQSSPKDEFGVTHDNMMYNNEEDKWYCLLDAPDKEAVVKHHEKHGFKCDWITEVKTTA